MKNDYCTQNNGDCKTCSLVNYGMDCRNNKLRRCDMCGVIMYADERSDYADIFSLESARTARHRCDDCYAVNRS